MTRNLDDTGSFYEAVYRLVRAIPRGRVMTYGQIATILGAPRAARAVGYALRACKSKDIPWQRVINHRGAISGRGDIERPHLQRVLLEREGVRFNAEDRCDLKKLRWEPPDPDEYAYADLDDADLPFR
ncbi:MAG: hypothetical protein AMXMBFR82_30440 [Candidatus Hydrogenedentota bacterium]